MNRCLSDDAKALVGGLLRLNQTYLWIELVVEADPFDPFAVQAAIGVELVRQILKSLQGGFADRSAAARQRIDMGNPNGIFRQCRKDKKARAQRNADHP